MYCLLLPQKGNAQSLGRLPLPSFFNGYTNYGPVSMQVHDSTLVFTSSAYNRFAQIPDYKDAHVFQVDKRSLTVIKNWPLPLLEPKVPNAGFSKLYGNEMVYASFEYFDEPNQRVPYVQLYNLQGEIIQTFRGVEFLHANKPFGRKQNKTILWRNNFGYVVNFRTGDTLAIQNLNNWIPADLDTSDVSIQLLYAEVAGDSLLVDYKISYEFDEIRILRSFFFMADTNMRVSHEVTNNIEPKRLEIEGELMQFHYIHKDTIALNKDTLYLEKKNLTGDVLASTNIIHNKIPFRANYGKHQLKIVYNNGHYLVVQPYFYQAFGFSDVNGIYVWLLDEKLEPLYEMNLIDSTRAGKFSLTENVHLDKDLKAYIVLQDGTDISYSNYDLLIIDKNGKVDSPHARTKHYLYDPGIYPNPAKDILYLINIPFGLPAQLLDLNGKVCWKGETAYSIVLGNLRKGLYFFQILSPEKTWETQKLLIE